MQNHLILLLPILLVPAATAIECYTGLKLIAGTSVGTETIRCDNSQAYCYNITASPAALLDVVKVGCSMWRCMLARDKCISTTFQNVPISLCCCSSNLCNVPENRGIRQQAITGWNTQPDRQDPEHVQHYNKQEVAQTFRSLELDDDSISSTPRNFRLSQDEIHIP